MAGGFDLVARLKLQDDFSSRMSRVVGQMGKAETATRRMSDGVKNFGKQVAGIGAAIGVTALVAKGFNAVTSSIDSAISRYDTLNAFPRVMEQVGFSAQVSQKAIGRLSEGIEGLPTTLDSVAGTAQRLGVMTQDLDGAVETTLALNNAFIASGSDAANAGRGLDQYVQMLSKGEVDLESWRTLQETMGLALNQTAEAFGYTGKAAQNDLYAALKDGTITFDEFNEKIIELSDAQGGFAEMARESSGGIATAWANVKTAVVKGVADMIGEIDKALGGTGSLEDGIKRMKDGVAKSFKAINGAIVPIANKLRDMYEYLEPYMPLLEKIGKAILIAIGAIAGIAAISGIISGISAAIGLLTSPIGLVVLAIAGIAFAFQQAYENSETFRNKVEGLVDGAKRIGEAFELAKEIIMSLFYDTGEVGDLLENFGISPEKATQAEAVITGIWNAITGFIENVKAGIGEVVAWLSEKWAELQPGIETMKSILTTAGTTIVSVFSSLWAVVGPILSGLWTAIQVVGDVVVTVFNNIIAPLVKYIWTLFQTLWSVIGPILELIGLAIHAAFKVLKFVWDHFIKPVAEYLMGQFKRAVEIATEKLGPIQSAFETLGDKISGVVDWLKSVAEWFKNIKVPDWVSGLGGKVAGFVGKTVHSFTGTPSSHYHGIDNVPYNGYNARLHKGEAVITAQENKERKQGGGSSFQFGDIHLHGVAGDMEKAANDLMRIIAAKVDEAGGLGA